MTQQIQTLKGFRDFLGVEVKKRQWLIENIKAVFERFGFEALETPALEYQELLMGKYGAEADKLIYKFEDQGERKVALRYDQTVPTARVVSQYQNQLVFPYKRYQIQPVWRAEKPQKGRYRELFQCDADIIGTSSLAADAEILSVYGAIYKEIGLESIQIKVNDRALLIKTIESSGIASENVFSVIQTIDKLDKKSEEEVIEELTQKGIALDLAKNVLTNLAKIEIPEKLAEILKIAVSMGTKKEVFNFTPTLARGLDYYTGLIFEGVIPEYPVGSVGGGGRYDNLLNQLVGYDQPAVGFGVGFDRTLEAAETAGKVPTFEGCSKVLVTIFSQELAGISFESAKKLRDQDISTEVYLDANKKLDAQLKYANKKQIPFVIIIGPEEVAKDTVKLKNMKTGEQSEVKVSEISSYLS